MAKLARYVVVRTPLFEYSDPKSATKPALFLALDCSTVFLEDKLEGLKNISKRFSHREIFTRLTARDPDILV